jgi:peptide methionine sulfoxide reductase MsrA
MAKESKERLNQSGKIDNRRIVTEIKSASNSIRREEYHQQYFQKCGLAH